MSRSVYRHALTFMTLLIIAVISLTALSLYFNVQSVDERYEKLAASVGSSVSNTIISIRKWNADQDGIYTQVTEKVQPNPYLEDPLRDVVTKEGLRLTKLNPAYMTRLFSEILQKRQGRRNTSDKFEADTTGKQT